MNRFTLQATQEEGGIICKDSFSSQRGKEKLSQEFMDTKKIDFRDSEIKEISLQQLIDDEKQEDEESNKVEHLQLISSIRSSQAKNRQEKGFPKLYQGNIQILETDNLFQPIAHGGQEYDLT